MSNWSTFSLPFEGLSLPRFLLTLEQSLAAFPGARVTFVELDADEDPDEPLASIEITLPRALVERHRAPEDPELPEDEDTPTAELSLAADDEETTLAVDLERNALVMPVLVKIVEDVLRRLEVLGDEDDEDDGELDEDNEDEDDLDEDEDEDDLDEDEDEDEALDEDEDDLDEDEGTEGGESPLEALRAVAENTFGATDGDALSFSFTIAWEEPPRRKEVRARAFEPAFAAGAGEGPSWIALQCEVSARAALEPSDALGLNTAADFQLSLDGDTYLLSATFPARALDAALFIEIAYALAEQADVIALAIEGGELASP